LATVERWVGAVGRLQPGVVAAVACVLCVLLLLGAFAAAWATGPMRGASIAAAAAFVVIVAAGLGLYAWRLGVPGRSAHRVSRPG
jgi:hypothetical protein